MAGVKGKGGPRPKPTALKLVAGVRKDRVNQHEASPPPSHRPPSPPPYLSLEAKRIWRRMARTMHTRKLLTEWDRYQFGIYCESIVQNQRALAMIQPEEPGGTPRLLAPAAKNSSVMVTNPAWRIFRDSAQLVRTYAAEFGLTPAARSEINVTPGTGRRDTSVLMPTRRHDAPASG